MAIPPVTAFSFANDADASVRTRLMGWRDHSTGIDLEIVSTTDPFGISVMRQDKERTGSTLVLRNAARASTGRLEQKLLNRPGMGIYEIDDGLPWDTGKLPGLGAWWKVPFRRDRIARIAAQAADRVIVGNNVLAEWAQTHCTDVRVIPTCIDTSEYDQKHSFEILDVPNIVWIGSGATEFELSAVSGALAEVHKATGARLHIIGAAGPIDATLLPFSNKSTWSLEIQREALARADVGIMPLADGVYQRAKCGYKLLQYAAAGVPAIASPVGVNAQMLENGLGLPARDPVEFADTLIDLLRASASQRSTLSARSRNAVELYTYDHWLTQWQLAMTP
jgi:glycosyltransferase involved in cell wall biosynthesis